MKVPFSRQFVKTCRRCKLRFPRVHRCNPLRLPPFRPKAPAANVGCKCRVCSCEVAQGSLPTLRLCAYARFERKDWRVGGMGLGGGLVVACFAQRVAEPFQTFVETVSGGGAG